MAADAALLARRDQHYYFASPFGPAFTSRAMPTVSETAHALVRRSLAPRTIAPLALARRTITILAAAAACSSDATSPPLPELGPLVNGVRTGGTTNLLVIPALFAQSAPSPFTQADLQRRLFDGPSPVGTLPAYFSEISGQRFRLRGTVTPWVRTSVGTSESGPGVEGASREHDYVIEALRSVDGAVHFGQYDNDGPDGRPNSGDDDGVVDGGVMLVTAEIGRHCGAEGVVWPHVSSLQFKSATDGLFRVADRTPSGVGIAVRAYAIISASTCNPGALTGIGIAAHELMHLFFRVTEMYSIGALSETQLAGARLWRTGCWDVMAAGSGWGCGAGTSQDITTPTHANPWVKETLFWLRTDTIGAVTDTALTLRAIADGGRTVRFLIGPGEFYEIEYRQKMGYDANIPASGVLIYHVSYARGVTPPTCQLWCTQPPLLVEADANNGLLRTLDQGGNRGEAGDAFGLFGRTAFSAATTPPAVALDGTPVALSVHSIQIDEAARVARLRVSHTAPP